MRRTDYRLFIDELFRLCRTLPIQVFDGTPESLGSIGIAWTQELTDTYDPLNQWFIDTPYAKDQQWINYAIEPLKLGVVLYWPTILRNPELRSATTYLLRIGVNIIERFDYTLAQTLRSKFVLSDQLFELHLHALLDNPTFFGLFYGLVRRIVWRSRWTNRLRFLWGCLKHSHKEYCPRCPETHWLKRTTSVCYTNSLFLDSSELTDTQDLYSCLATPTPLDALIRHILCSHSIEEGYEPLTPDTGRIDLIALSQHVNIPVLEISRLLTSVDDVTSTSSLINMLEITKTEKLEYAAIRRSVMFPGTQV